MLGVCPFGLLVVPPIQPVRVRLGPRRKDIKPAGQMADDDQAGDILFSRHHQQKKTVFRGIFQSLYYLRHKMWDEGGLKEALTRIPPQYLLFAFSGSNQKLKLTPSK